MINRLKIRDCSDMKKLIIILVVALFIGEIIIGSLLLFDVQLIKTPKTTINIDLVEITPEQVLVRTTLNFTNPNPFTLLIQNLHINTITENGEKIIDEEIASGNIPANGNKLFTSEMTIAFQDDIPNQLYSTFSGTIGIQILGIIQKTLPLEVTIVTNVTEALQNLVIPVVHLQAKINTITENGVNFTGTVDVDNPNPFELTVENISLIITTDTGTQVGTFSVRNGLVPAKGVKQFTASGDLLFIVLNAKTVNITLQGTASAHVAGAKKTLPIHAEALITVPWLSDLLVSENPIELSLKGELKLTLRGLRANVSLNIYNPYVIELVAYDLECSLYRVDHDVETLLGNTKLQNCTVQADDANCLSGIIQVPYRTLLFSGRRIFPDWFELRLQGNFSFEGIDQSLPLSIRAYLDVHLLR